MAPDTPDPAPVLASLAASLAETRRRATDVRNIIRLLESTDLLVRGAASPLDVKIAGLAVTEMVRAFEMFAPHRDEPKVTIFGSARTQHDSPIWAQTVEVARRLAEQGHMVVTGAGPGIMEAGMVGAGRERSIGVSIRLPFETGANSVIAGDDKYVSMRYFFTRKLMLVKESRAFLCLPGGFGTLDETFELLTLAQTGKSVPVPIVFLDVPGNPFWAPIMDTLSRHLLENGLISTEDTSLYTVTDDVDEAVRVITAFYVNYHSLRFVGDVMHLRMQRQVPDDALADISARHGHLSADGVVRRIAASPAELRDDDVPDLPRLALDYTGKGFAPLMPLLADINRH
jgi:uncharacterized protein (TIGR00730 family)